VQVQPANGQLLAGTVSPPLAPQAPPWQGTHGHRVVPQCRRVRTSHLLVHPQGALEGLLLLPFLLAMLFVVACFVATLVLPCDGESRSTTPSA